MTLTFQALRDTLKESRSIRGMDIPEEHLTTTYCWGNTLLHSAIRRTQEDQDDVNLDNVKVLLEKAQEYQNLDAVFALQMRWEDKDVEVNRYEKKDNNLLLMTPLTFAIYEGKEKAVEEILSADKEIAYKFLAQDILNNISSTHEKKTKFYARILEFAIHHDEIDDKSIIDILTVKLIGKKNITLFGALLITDSKKFNSVLEAIKNRKEVLEKVLLNQDYTLLHFAILNKSTEAFEAILEAVKDDKEILKAVLTAETHHYLHYYRTPLEFCIYHYNQCDDYCNKSEKDKEVIKDIKEATGSFSAWDYTNDEDFKKIKNFTETILNSARDNGILEDVLTASGIKKDLAKKLSDRKYSNDVIINMLQQNQKAEERGSKVGIVSGLITLPSLILICTKCAKMSTGGSVAIGIVSAIAVTYAIGYGVYKLGQPNTKMLETDEFKIADQNIANNVN